jgi:hypothetical protein
MQDVVSISATAGQGGGRRVLSRLLSYLPNSNRVAPPYERTTA